MALAYRPNIQHQHPSLSASMNAPMSVRGYTQRAHPSMGGSMTAPMSARGYTQHAALDSNNMSARGYTQHRGQVFNNQAKNVTFQPGFALGMTVHGGEVIEIHRGGQAEQAGVKVGDAIKTVGGVECNGYPDQILKRAQQGSTPYQVMLETKGNFSLATTSTEQPTQTPFSLTTPRGTDTEAYGGSFVTNLPKANLKRCPQASFDTEQPTQTPFSLTTPRGTDTQAKNVTFQPGFALGMTIHGSQVIDVRKGGQAEREGVEVGDVIKGVGGMESTGYHDKLIKHAQQGSAPYQVMLETKAAPMSSVGGSFAAPSASRMAGSFAAPSASRMAGAESVAIQPQEFEQLVNMYPPVAPVLEEVVTKPPVPAVSEEVVTKPPVPAVSEEVVTKPPVPVVTTPPVAAPSEHKPKAKAKFAFIKKEDKNGLDQDTIQLVSLGCACGPKLAFEELGRGAETLPFDWITTTSDGILGFLRSGFQGFFSFEKKEEKDVGGVAITAFRTRRHGFWHDDPTSEATREKYNRRFKRMLEISAHNRPVLFVRLAATSDEILTVDQMVNQLIFQFGPQACLLLIIDLQLEDAPAPCTVKGVDNLLIHYLHGTSGITKFCEPIDDALDWAAYGPIKHKEVQDLAAAHRLAKPVTPGYYGMGGMPAFEGIPHIP